MWSTALNATPGPHASCRIRPGQLKGCDEPCAGGRGRPSSRRATPGHRHLQALPPPAHHLRCRGSAAPATLCEPKADDAPTPSSPPA
eukprot:8236756-Pyramimonas_sp.AAC.1